MNKIEFVLNNAEIKKCKYEKMDKATQQKQIDFLLNKVELKITFPPGELIRVDCLTRFKRDDICISPEVEDAIIEIALERLRENIKTHLDSTFKEKNIQK